MDVLNIIDLTSGDDDTVEDPRHLVTVDVDASSAADSKPSKVYVSPPAIDLLSSSDDDNDNDVDEFSVEWYDAKPAAKRSKSGSRSIVPTVPEESTSFRPMIEHRSWLARKEQEQRDEALARYLQQQEHNEEYPKHSINDSLSSSSHRGCPPSSREEVHALFDPTTNLLDDLQKTSDNDYEVVAKVTKELDDKLSSLGFPLRRKKKIGLTQKIQKLRGISKSCRDDMLSLQQWRNKLIHNPDVQQLSDIHITKEIYLEKYVAVLHMLATQKPSLPPPKQTQKRKQIKPPKHPPKRQPQKG